MSTERAPRRRATAKSNVIPMPATDFLQPPASREEAVARRAYEIFQARGGEHGRDFEDWLQAEREIGERYASDRQAS